MNKRMRHFVLFVSLFSLIIVHYVLAQPSAFQLTVAASDTGKGFKLTWSALQSPPLMPGESVEHYLVRREPNNGIDPPDSIHFVPLDILLETSCSTSTILQRRAPADTSTWSGHIRPWIGISQAISSMCNSG